MNKYLPSYMIVCIAILIVLTPNTISVSNEECYGWSYDLPYNLGGSEGYPGSNGEPNQPVNEIAEARRDKYQDEIPPNECVLHFEGAQQSSEDLDCTLVNHYNQESCDTGSVVSGSRNDQCLCYKEQVISVTNTFHGSQVCEAAQFAVVYDEHDYYCEGCTFDEVEGKLNEYQSGVWDQSNVPDNPCCGDDLTNSTNSREVRALVSDWVSASGEDSYVNLPDQCGVNVPSHLGVDCDNNPEATFTCEANDNLRCVDIVPSNNPTDCCSGGGTCRPYNGCYDDEFYENTCCVAPYDALMSLCSGCNAWRDHCCQCVGPTTMHSIVQVTCSGQPTTETCDPGAEATPFTCTAANDEVCLDIAEIDGVSQWRYVTCIQDQGEDDPDSSERFCLNCMAGETDTAPTEQFGVNPRTWHASDTDPLSSCCGDDDLQDMFMMHGNLLCWKATTPAGHTYGDDYSPLVASGSSNNPPTSSDGYNMQFYWTDPGDIPYKVIKVEDSGEMLTDDIEFLAYNSEWHACWPGSFSRDTIPINVNQMSVFDTGNPVANLDYGGYTSFLCSNAAFSGDNIAKNFPPEIFECGETKIRGFGDDNKIIGGVDAAVNDMHYYSGSDIVGIEYGMNAFFIGSDEETEFPEFTDIDSMVYMDSESPCMSHGKCLVVTSGDTVWDYDGITLTSHPLGDNHHFNNDINVVSIDALSWVRDSFGINHKYFGVLTYSSGASEISAFFTYDGDATIEEGDIASGTENILEGCDTTGLSPSNVKSIMAFYPPYGGVSYDTIVINTENSRYYFEEREDGCHSYTAPAEYNVDYTHSRDKMTSAASFVPEAATFIYPNAYYQFNLPRYTGSTILFDDDARKIYSMISPAVYCTPRTWSTNLDESQNFEETCSNYADDTRRTHQWTGAYCCGEGEDAFETYLDTYSGDVPYDRRVCYQGRTYGTGDHIYDYNINRESADSPNLLEELLVDENKILSCAVDHTRTCTMQNIAAANNFGACDEHRNENKPYEGTGNLLKSGTNMKSDDNKGWKITGGRALGDTLLSQHWAGSCYQGSSECFKLHYRNNVEDLPVTLSQPVYNIKPGQTYHLSAYMIYVTGENSDHQQITMTYNVEDPEGTEIQHTTRTFNLTTSWERYDLIFTSPTNAGDYSLDECTHSIEFSVESATGTIDHNILVDNAKLSSNDYLLSIKDFPDPYNNEDYGSVENLLGDPSSDYGDTYQYYCQTQDVEGDDGYPDYYCGFDEKFHPIEELVPPDLDPIEYDLERIRATSDLRLKYLNWSPIFGLVPESERVAGCCFKDQCWAGEADGCVEPVNSGRPPLYPNQSVVDTAGSGYACILDEESGEANWVNVSPKWYWDNSQHGYCVSESQCLVDWNGNISHNNIPSDYSRMEKAFPPDRKTNPICIDDGQYILDHYCDNGNWSTRTQIIAETLMQYPEPGDEFSIFCGSHQDALNVDGFDIHQVYPDFAPNHYSDGEHCTFTLGDTYPRVRNVSSTYFSNMFYTDTGTQDTGCLIRDCMYRSHDDASPEQINHPCINDVCVLYNSEGETLIGFSHNRKEDHLSGDHYPISNFFGYSTTQAFCNNVVTGNSDSFSKCTPDNNNYEVYYNPIKKIVILSKSNTGNPDNFNTNHPLDIQGIIDKMKSHFWDIQDPMEGLLVYPLELNYSGNYSNFFYTQSDEGGTLKRAYGTTTKSDIRGALNPQQYSGLRTDMFVGFEGFSSIPICGSFNNLSDGNDYYCDIVSDETFISSQGDVQNVYFNLYWSDLTAKLRLFR